ncbi:TniB family NTP-binding protein [Streptomyces sp. CLV115]|uniref:TniB family NTP-binding protein n=1 Tax=Streptomyces sp. CLV115 TaxID=3138502 RepID=UPI00406C8174
MSTAATRSASSSRSAQAQRGYGRQSRPRGRRAQVPVAYVLVPPAASARTLATEFARHLGIPITTRMTQAQITSAVCATYAQAGIRLVLIDEIHRLNPHTSTGAETTDLSKDLTERIGARFVYAGIDVTRTELFTGVRGVCSLRAGDSDGVPCTTDPGELVSCARGLERVAVFATYAAVGLGVLQRAHGAGLGSWDLVVVDEAPHQWVRGQAVGRGARPGTDPGNPPAVHDRHGPDPGSTRARPEW